MRDDRVRIRDPIYGNVYLSRAELRIVEHQFFQRLRRIKQLGFGEYVYPGAVHTRFLHSLGVLEAATRVFDQLFGDSTLLSNKQRKRFRQAVRLAALLHDIGHSPLSHVAEGRLPTKSEVLPLKVKRALGKRLNQNAQATHEDYTAAILLHPEMRSLIESVSTDAEVQAEDVVSILIGLPLEGSAGFVESGIDFLPVLHQIISSELDADRMDYLLRDALFCGVSYGRYDQDWLISNLDLVIEHDRAFLGILRKAVFSFEDFLLSRYHMFVTVYLHYRSRGFNRMLTMFFEEEGYTFPADVEKYCALDDVALYRMLEQSQCKWARYIREARSYHRLFEINSYDTKQRSFDIAALEHELTTHKIPWFKDRAVGLLSYYHQDPTRDPLPIFVLTPDGGKFHIREYSPLFERFSKPLEFLRVFVEPEKATHAEAVLDQFLRSTTEPNHSKSQDTRRTRS